MNKTIKEFYNLEAWRKANSLALSVYKLTKDFPKEELYGIISQMRRAAISVTSNIAEGFSRYHFNDKVRFYYNSRGSVSEVQSLILLSFDLGYIKKSNKDSLLSQCDDVRMLINGLIRSIENQKDV